MILIDWILIAWYGVLSWLHVWTGSRLFPIVVIYSPCKENVIGLTFTVNREYADKIIKIDEEDSVE